MMKMLKEKDIVTRKEFDRWKACIFGSIGGHEAKLRGEERKEIRLIEKTERKNETKIRLADFFFFHLAQREGRSVMESSR